MPLISENECALDDEDEVGQTRSYGVLDAIYSASQDDHPSDHSDILLPSITYEFRYIAFSHGIKVKTYF